MFLTYVLSRHARFIKVLIAGWKGLLIRSCSGIYAEWKVGLLQMLILSHSKAGIRQVFLFSPHRFIPDFMQNTLWVFHGKQEFKVQTAKKFHNNCQRLHFLKHYLYVDIY